MDISVVVPIYKGNKYIENIIRMIEANELFFENEMGKKDIELIFVNDFPEEKIGKLYSEKIFVSYIENEQNRGIHYSRTQGIKSAKGEYIHLLDQDDIIEEKFYYTQMESLKSNSIVVCNGYYRGDKLIFDASLKTFDKHRLITDRCTIISPGQVVLKKEIIPAIWLNDIMENSGSDDWFLWILLVLEGYEFSYNEIIGYHHIEHDENTSLQWDKMITSNNEILKKLRNMPGYSQEEKAVAIKTIEKRNAIYDKVYQFKQKYQSLIENQEHLMAYFEKNKYKSFAIYGFAAIGKELLSMLKKCGIETCYIVDRDSRFKSEQIFRPEENLPRADLMIISTVRDIDEIKQKMSEKNIGRILTYEEFFGELQAKTYTIG